MIARLKALLNYRMAFSRWLWLYALVMVVLLALSMMPEIIFQSAHLWQSSVVTFGLISFALGFTWLTVGHFKSFMARIELFARAIADGNLNTPMPTQDDHGEVARIFQAMNEMQQQLSQHFNALRNEEAHNALLVQAINQSSNSVMVTDLHARIVYVNDAFVDNSGYTRDEVIGHTPKLIQSGKTSPLVYQQMRTLLAQGDSWRGELINRRKDGSEFIETVSITPVRDAQGQIYRYMAVKEDITEMRRAQDSIERLAYYDPLTDLPNRRYFLDQLNRKIAAVRRQSDQFSLIFIDLNRFKEINDSQGHVVGDKVLMEVAARFAAKVRDNDLLARLGGDEFVLVVEETDPKLLDSVVKRLLATLRYGVRVSEGRYDISASFGVAIYPHHGDNSADLLRHADVAMYQAKHSPSHVVIYDRRMSEKVEREVAIAGQLQQALKDGTGLELYVQGQFNITTREFSGGEVLLRWHDPLMGRISPADFIPIAEERGLIGAVDKFVLQQSCQALQQWQQQGRGLSQRLSVNVSMASFEQADFGIWLEQLLDRFNINGQQLELEITESGLMHNPKGALKTASLLKQLGISLAIDDFGTGYSSLAYLKQFNATKVKVDQAFIMGITDQERSQAIVRATIGMVRELGMQVLAEGVETEQDAAWLVAAGCQFAQGYLFARPMRINEFADSWLPS